MADTEKKISFKVDGMSCNHCKKSIESAVKALEGVTDASVSLEQNLVEISYDSNVVGRDELDRAIKNAGYQVVS